MATAYEPRPGSVVQRAIAHLESLDHGAELTSSRLAEAIGAPALGMIPGLDAARNHGAIFSRKKDDHIRAPLFWSLVDHSKAKAVVQRAMNGNTPALDSQHVLKAEAARPDATDRENPATRSPVGGPMGAEQPAAAGLADDEIKLPKWLERPSSPVEKPEAPIGLRGKNAALWLSGELAFEADDGTVIVFDAATAKRMAGFLRAMVEGQANQIDAKGSA